jgi:hypothetical protein
MPGDLLTGEQREDDCRRREDERQEEDPDQREHERDDRLPVHALLRVGRRVRHGVAD